MNEGVDIRCKTFTTQVFTVLGLLVEFGTVIEKSQGYLTASTYISKPYVKVTSNRTVIYYYLFSSLFFSSTLQYIS